MRTLTEKAAGAAEVGIGWRHLTATRIALGAGLLALAIGAYQLSLPHVLTGVLGYNEGYDDGVYVGATIRFVHGALPYRDFVLVHPPGIVLILAPIGLIGSVTTSHAALILARCLTVAVTALNPVLAGLLVRRQGRLAVAVASLSLALWPLTVSVDRGVELEPYLLCFALLGGLIVFGQDTGENAVHQTTRRLLAGGVLLGVACAIKAWGVFPALAAVAVLLPRPRAAARLLTGIVAGAAVVCLPFLLAAPHSFLHDVVVAQSQRTFGASTSIAERLTLITGTAGLPLFGIHPLTSTGDAAPAAFTGAEALGVAAAALLAVALTLVFGVDRRRRTPMEWWLFGSAVISAAAMLLSSSMADHYGYLPAAFVAPLLGVCAAGARYRWFPGRFAGHGRRVLMAGVAVLAGAALVGTQDVSYARRYLAEAGSPPDLASYVPAGACVISDFPSDLLATDRFTSTVKGCPLVVDPLGMYLADDGGRGPHPAPPYPLAFSYLWLTYLQRAQYLDLRIPYSDFIPWDEYMIEWFPTVYRLAAHLHDIFPEPFVDSVKDVYIYEHAR